MPVTAGDVAIRFATLGDDDIDSAIRDVLLQIGSWAEQYGATRCFVVRWHDDGTFSIAAEWHAGHLAPLIDRWGVDRVHRLDRMDYWTDRERRGISDGLTRATDVPEHAAEERAVLADDGADAYLNALIRKGDETRGILAWRFEDNRGDPGQVAAVADDLAGALAVALLRLDDLDDPGIALTERLLGADDDDVQEVFNAGSADLGRSVGADWVRVLRHHPESASAAIIAGWHRPDADPPPRRPVDPSIRFPLDRIEGSTDAAAQARLTRIDDTTASADRSQSSRFWRSIGVHSVLVVPVQPRGDVLGWVYVTRTGPNPGWTDRDIRRVRRFALSLRPTFSRMDSVAERRRAMAEHSEQLAASLALVSELSHQLKTPLHAISGYAELIDSDSLTASDRTALDHVRESARELVADLEDVLMVARGDAGAARIRPALDAATEHLATEIEARRLHVDSDIGPTALVPINQARTRQLLRSLVRSLFLAAGAGSTIRVTATDDDLTAHLDSTAPIPAHALSFPLVTALLGNDGIVETARVANDREDGGESIRVRIRFGPID